MGKNKFEHAEHNEKVCNYLDRKQEFTDWVITTAFYSAYHYLKGCIFPITLTNGKKKNEYQNFDHYYTAERTKGSSLGKHQTFADLVKKQTPEVGAAYKQLMNISWTARYLNYKHTRKVSDTAKKKLKKIKTRCQAS